MRRSNATKDRSTSKKKRAKRKRTVNTKTTMNKFHMVVARPRNNPISDLSILTMLTTRRPTTVRELKKKERDMRNERKDALENQTRFGFDTRTNAIRVDGRTYRGATNTLKNTFYSNYKCPVEKRRSRKKKVVCSPQAAHKRRMSTIRYSSSKTKGDNFHRHVYHFFMCQQGVVEEGTTRKRCVHCKQRFGVYAFTVNTTCTLFTMIDAVHRTLNGQALSVVTCEAPVAWRRMNTGTLLDMVCMDSKGRLVVIELKTGYNPQFRVRPSTIGTPNHTMLGFAGKHIPNSPLHQHMLQLWFSVQALKDTHDGYDVRDGLLIYFDNAGNSSTYCLSEWDPFVSQDHIEEQLYKVAVLNQRSV